MHSSRLVVMVCVWVGLLGGTSIATTAYGDATTSVECGDEVETEGAHEFAESLGISFEEACRRLRVQREKGPLILGARSAFPSSFGGSWINHEQSGTINLAFTRDAVDPLSQLQHLIPSGASVEVVTVARSERELDEIAFRVRNDPLLMGMGEDVKYVDVRLDLNRVIIGASSSRLPELQSHFEDLGDSVGVEAFDVEVAATACTRTDCDPPLRGGLRIEESGLSAYCTLGFMARNTLGNRYAISAGHGSCPQKGEYWDHRNQIIGGVTESMDSGSVDASRIGVSSTSVFSPGDGYYIWHSDSAQLLQVHYVAIYGEYQPGDYVYKSGARTLTKRGKIVSINSSAHYNTEQIKVASCAYHGDSGAPVYDYGGGAAHAVGVQQAATTGDTVCASSGEYYWASHAVYVEDALNVKINTKTWH